MITVDDVTVGAGARACLASVLPAGARRVAVVTQDGVPAVDVPRPHEVVRIGDGEAHKTLATVE